MSNEYIESILKPELEKLEKNKDHLLGQIETFKDMIHNYNIKLDENEEKINQLKTILYQIEKPTI